jgi:hypothetical protein
MKPMRTRVTSGPSEPVTQGEWTVFDAFGRFMVFASGKTKKVSPSVGTAESDPTVVDTFVFARNGSLACFGERHRR